MRLSSRDLLAVGGLLHDVGKFPQRRGERGAHAEIGASLIDELGDLFPYDWLDDLRDGVGNHHRPPRKEIEKIVKLADWLASGERREVAGIARQDPAEAALVPITARVALLHDPPEGTWGYRLRPLALDAEVIFPVRDHQLSPEDYEQQWNRFRAEVGRLPKLQDRQQIGSLAALLRKYVCFVPSATPWEEDEEFRTLPDISLYDHLKVTSGLCAALTGLSPDHLDALLRREDAVQDRSVCLAIRADLSGIQPFIYRITEGGAEGKGTAKRLRGRSLYITLLAEAMALSLLERLDMPPRRSCTAVGAGSISSRRSAPQAWSPSGRIGRTHSSSGDTGGSWACRLSPERSRRGSSPTSDTSTRRSTGRSESRSSGSSRRSSRRASPNRNLCTMSVRRVI